MPASRQLADLERACHNQLTRDRPRGAEPDCERDDDRHDAGDDCERAERELGRVVLRVFEKSPAGAGESREREEEGLGRGHCDGCVVVSDGGLKGVLADATAG